MTKAKKVETVVEEAPPQLPLVVTTNDQIKAALQVVKTNIETIKHSVAKLNVKTDSDLTIARQRTKELNEEIKYAKKICKDLKQPAKTIIEMIGKVEDELIGDAQEILKIADQKVLAYNELLEIKRKQEQEKLRLEQLAIQRKAEEEAAIEQKRVNDIKVKVLAVFDKFMEAISKADVTRAQLMEANNTYIKRFNEHVSKEILKEFPDLCNEVIDKMNTAGTTAWDFVMQREAVAKGKADVSLEPETNLQEKLKEIAQEVEQTAHEEVNASVEAIKEEANINAAALSGDIHRLDNAKSNGLRDAGWDYEVANDKGDLDMVSNKFLMVDDSKVKAWIKANKDKIEAGAPYQNWPGYSRNDRFIFAGIAFFKKPKTVVH